jgi:hypothetical protein
MNTETLEKAKKLQDEIRELERELNDLPSNHSKTVLRGDKSETVRKFVTARCPDCNMIIMASVYPYPTDREAKKEMMDLISAGYAIKTEINPNIKDEFGNHKKECLFGKPQPKDKLQPQLF